MPVCLRTQVCSKTIVWLNLTPFLLLNAQMTLNSLLYCSVYQLGTPFAAYTRKPYISGLNKWGLFPT